MIHKHNWKQYGTAAINDKIVGFYYVCPDCNFIKRINAHINTRRFKKHVKRSKRRNSKYQAHSR